MAKKKQKFSKEFKKAFSQGKVEITQKELKCTCPDTCGSACKGQCGCKKCRNEYSDFLSVE